MGGTSRGDDAAGKRGARALAWACAWALVQSGCATTGTPDPTRAPVLASPNRAPVKTITDFTQSLRCMDELFLAYGKRDIRITSEGVVDRTGAVRAGTRDMLISAVSKMSTKSNAFIFVDFDLAAASITALQEEYIGRGRFQTPSYYIRGAVTQADLNVMADTADIGVAFPFASFGIDQGQLASVIAVDLNMGNMLSRSIIPGAQSTNSITLIQRDRGGDVEALLQKASAYYGISSDRNESAPQAVRTLIELGTIELLGKFTQVPYWRCLDIDTSDPAVRREALDWYSQMDTAQRSAMAQSALASIGYYSGPVDGRGSAALGAAVQRYKSEYDLIATPEIDFDLYFSFLINDLATGGGQNGSPMAAEAPPPPVSPPTAAPRGKLALNIQPSKTIYRRNEPLSVEVSVDQDAYVYCYLHRDGSVTKVFPSHYRPNAWVAGGQTLRIPGSGDQFTITLDEPGEEDIMCAALEQPYPEERSRTLQIESLQVYTLPLWELLQAHQDIGGFNSEIQTATYTIQ